MYVAGPRYRGGPGDDRREGDPVPEAAQWKHLQMWEESKHVRWVPDAPAPAEIENPSLPIDVVAEPELLEMMANYDQPATMTPEGMLAEIEGKTQWKPPEGPVVNEPSEQERPPHKKTTKAKKLPRSKRGRSRSKG